MGYNKHVTSSNATIPSENVEAARLRLEEMAGYSANTLEKALRRGRWDTTTHPDGSCEINWYDGDHPGEDEEEALQKLGDLFTPDSTMYWIGEDDDQWAWRFNHKGHAFIEASAHVAYEEVEPAPGWVGESPTSKQRDWKLNNLTRCAITVDEAADVLTMYMADPAMGLDSLLSVLVEAREEILLGARPELAEQWRALETRARHLEKEGLTDDDYEQVRDARDGTFRAIVDEASGAAVPGKAEISPAGEGIFALTVLSIVDREGKWGPELVSRVSSEARAHFRENPVLWLNTEATAVVDAKLHDAAMEFLDGYSTSKWVSGPSVSEVEPTQQQPAFANSSTDHTLYETAGNVPSLEL